MRNESQTLIATLRLHVSLWRKANDWSRERLMQHIVEVHDKVGGPALTNIRWEPPTRDVFERNKVNADRFFRWLDDESKDNALLPANFIPSILRAMPQDVRLACLNDLLSPFELYVVGFGCGDNDDLNIHLHLQDVVKGSGEAIVALSRIADDPSIQRMENAERELGQAIESKGRARRAIRSAIERCKAAGVKVLNVAKRGVGKA